MIDESCDCGDCTAKENGRLRAELSATQAINATLSAALEVARTEGERLRGELAGVRLIQDSTADSRDAYRTQFLERSRELTEARRKLGEARELLKSATPWMWSKGYFEAERDAWASAAEKLLLAADATSDAAAAPGPACWCRSDEPGLHTGACPRFPAATLAPAAPCTCGSGLHPRRCAAHPERYRQHCDEISAENQDSDDLGESSAPAAPGAPGWPFGGITPVSPDTPPKHVVTECGDCVSWCTGCLWRRWRALPYNWEPAPAAPVPEETDAPPAPGSADSTWTCVKCGSKHAVGYDVSWHCARGGSCYEGQRPLTGPAMTGESVFEALAIGARARRAVDNLPPAKACEPVAPVAVKERCAACSCLAVVELGRRRGRVPPIPLCLACSRGDETHDCDAALAEVRAGRPIRPCSATPETRAPEIPQVPCVLDAGHSAACVPGDSPRMFERFGRVLCRGAAPAPGKGTR